MCDTLYASLAASGRGHSFVLSRPTWMDGGKMSVNEKGVAIGNEAVFSRFKAKKKGVLGMDIIRATLAAHALVVSCARLRRTSLSERYSRPSVPMEAKARASPGWRLLEYTARASP